MIKIKKGGFFYRFAKNKLALVALCVMLAILAITIVSNIVLDFKTDIVAQNVENRFQPPSSAHWLGTDEYGRDILKRILYGGKYSISIGVASVAVSLAAGILIGAFSGFCGGVVDNIIMRIMDVFLSMPLILMAMVIVAALGPGLTNVVWALAISTLPQYARQVRVAILTIRGEDYIEAARAVGTSNFHLIWHHMLPNVIGPIIVQATLSVASIIMMASSLSYLGLGISAPLPEWGAMLSNAKSFIRTNPMVAMYPCIAIVLTVLCINLIGDGIRDAIDPRLRD